MKTPENAGFKMFLEANCGLTNGRDGGDDLAKLELVQDGGLAGGVKTDHQDAHFFLAEKALEQCAERLPHDDVCMLIRLRRFCTRAQGGMSNQKTASAKQR